MVGVWTFPGGKLLAGETIAQGVAREVLEETGLRVLCGDLVEVVEIVTEGYHYVIHDHLCTLLEARGVVTAGDDAAEARFFRLDTLSQLNTTEATQRVAARAVAILRTSSDDE
jgi:ADP-ribose pyrophosphatase YjhB (NUDIX family)